MEAPWERLTLTTPRQTDPGDLFTVGKEAARLAKYDPCTVIVCLAGAIIL